MNMGDYTEFDFNVRVKATASKAVLQVIQFAMGTVEGRDSEEPLPDHPLFHTKRWHAMFRSGSSYFDAQPHSLFYWGDIEKCWILNVRCNLKNYDQEFEKFLDWITPHLEHHKGDFLGFLRYPHHEEDIPTLIYHPNKLVYPNIQTR